MEHETALQLELESQLSSLRRKGRMYFGAYTYAILPPFTRTAVEEIALRIRQTCMEGYAFEELGFCSCAFGHGGMEALEEFLLHNQSTSRLESLVFSAVSGVDNNGVARLVQACPDLRMLKISLVASGAELGQNMDNSVGMGGDVNRLMCAARRLEVLNLMGLESYQMNDFSRGLSQLSLLRELHLTMKNISPQHLNGMLDSLHRLNIDSLNIRLSPPQPDASYDDGCLKRLTRLLHKGKLKSLILYIIPGLFSVDKQTLNAFLEEFRVNTSLRRLELGHTLGVNEEVAVSLFKALEDNAALSRFSWSTRSMKAGAWIGLLKSMPKMSHVSELTFSGSGDCVLSLDKELKSKLLAALHQNTALTNFRFEKEYQVFATDRMEPLQQLSRRNACLRKARAATAAALVGDNFDLYQELFQVRCGLPKPPGWKEAYWPTVISKLNKKVESASAVYFIIQRRTMHWIDPSPSPRRGRKRPSPTTH